MKVTFVFFVCVAAVYCYPTKEQLEYFEGNEQIIDYVNSKQTTWKAGHNFGKYMTLKHIAGLCGALKDDNTNSALPSMFNLIYLTFLKKGNLYTEYF